MNIRDAIMIAESLGYEILSNEKEESFSVIENCQENPVCLHRG